MIVTRFAVRHFMGVLVLCVGLVLMGSAAYLAMPREHFPDVKVPFVTVTTVLDGANPTDVETSITVPLETELDSVEDVDEMRSSSSTDVSVVSLKFDPELDTEVALARVRDAVDKAKGELPPEADDPIVKEFSFSGDVPVMVLNLVGPDTMAVSELKDLAEKFEEDLKRIPGVLDVRVRGGRDRQILIEVDPDRMASYHLSMPQVEAALRGTNRNVSAGVAEGPTNRVIMRVPGEFRSPADIFSLVVGRSPGGVPIHMRDVASVRYDFEDATSIARLYDFRAPDGKHSIGRYVEPRKSVSIEVMKKSGENILAVTDTVRERVAGLALPDDVKVVIALDNSKDVRSMVSDLENGIGTSLILVLVVILVGLGARNALLVAWAIPFSMLLSIVTLNLMGITLNMMVLYSLILALGMLVDNAIVIVENIYRHYCLGLTRAQAAIKGTSEVAWPVITSTATTVAAFLPMVFWPGLMGEFMSFLPKTVIIVLTSSLFVALVINPTLCALVMKRKKGAVSTVDPETERPTYRAAVAYGKLLGFLLDRPVWTLSTSFVILSLSVALYVVFGAGTEFFPTIDPKLVMASLTPPEGTSLEASDRLSRRMEDRLFGRPGSGYDHPVANLEHASTTVGLIASGGFGEEGLGPVVTRVQFVDREDRTEPSALTLAEMRNRLEGLDAAGNPVAPPLFGAEFNIVKPQEGPPTGKPVSVDVFGDDLNEMTAVVRDMKELMASVPGVAKPIDDAATAQPTLEWRVDRERAGMLGLDQRSVAGAIQMSVGGARSGTFGHGDDEQDILIRLPRGVRVDTGRLATVPVPSPLGAAVPLTSVASADLVPGPVTIKHFNRKRVVNAGAEVQPWVRADADVRAAFQAKVAGYPFPPGVTHRFGGAAKDQDESTRFLIKAFVVALFLITMVLVVQFNSILVPGIVMTSVVLSFIGVFAGLLTFHMPFGIIMSGIGVISLAGVVVNNAIVLLDAVRQFQQRGQSAREAVVSAGMVRFRPVLLTAITTILGLVPMAAKLNIDFLHLTWQFNTESSQWWQSMAVAIIFGLAVATVLTLGVVPTLYLLYARFRLWLFQKLGWKVDREMDIMGLADELAALEKGG